MMFDNHEKLENLAIFWPWGRNFDLSEKLTEIVSLSFLTSFRALFPRFFFTTNRILPTNTTNRSRDRV